MRFFKRGDEPKMITCPSCCQLIASDALECDLCGADLREIPEERRQAAMAQSDLGGSRSPYAR